MAATATAVTPPLRWRICAASVRTRQCVSAPGSARGCGGQHRPTLPGLSTGALRPPPDGRAGACCVCARLARPDVAAVVLVPKRERTPQNGTMSGEKHAKFCITRARLETRDDTSARSKDTSTLSGHWRSTTAAAMLLPPSLPPPLLPPTPSAPSPPLTPRQRSAGVIMAILLAKPSAEPPIAPTNSRT